MNEGNGERVVNGISMMGPGGEPMSLPRVVGPLHGLFGCTAPSDGRQTIARDLGDIFLARDHSWTSLRIEEGTRLVLNGFAVSFEETPDAETMSRIVSSV